MDLTTPDYYVTVLWFYRPLEADAEYGDDEYEYEPW